MSTTFTRRPVTDDDEQFLQILHATVTWEQLRLGEAGLSEEQNLALLSHQYNAYSHFYRNTYRDAADCVIEVDGRPAGRLIIIDLPGEIRLSDIMIMPEFRRRGICTAVMREEIARARELGVEVTLHVEQTNPALELYRREGFVVRGESETHFVMEWREDQLKTDS